MSHEKAELVALLLQLHSVALVETSFIKVFSSTSKYHHGRQEDGEENKYAEKVTGNQMKKQYKNTVCLWSPLFLFLSPICDIG